MAQAHGNALENLLKNPTLVDLVGGIQSVTLGDDEARRRGTQKTVLERAAQPTFEVCIEILDRQTLAVHRNVAEAVDQLLRGWQIHPEIRRRDETTGDFKVVQKPEPTVTVSMVEASNLSPAIGPRLRKPTSRSIPTQSARGS